MITPATPLQIGTMNVPGRLYKSATSETRASDDGYVTSDLLDFYRPMVAAGTPLIVTGNLYVSRQGQSAGRQAGIDTDDKMRTNVMTPVNGMPRRSVGSGQQ